jgi:hypothetical protein
MRLLFEFSTDFTLAIINIIFVFDELLRVDRHCVILFLRPVVL